MKSVGLARRAAAFSASAAVLAAMVTGLVSGPAQAATPAAAGKAVQAAAAGTAGHKPKVSITTPKATPGDYQGACPVKVNLSSTIKVPVKGKTELAYRWLHGDGSKGKVKVVKLKGHGNKYVKVKESLTFNGDVKGWEAVQVLGPRKAVSKKGYFSVSCDNGDHGDDNIQVWARAWADPDSYVGPCTPGDKIDFGGVIKVNRPTWVKYRWVLNGDVVDGGTIKVWDSRRVDLGYSPRQSQRGWAQLVIVGPDEGASNRAYYKVWCKDETPHVKVSATNLVTGTNHDGCKVGANANINSTGPARVKYVWSVNGTPVAKDEAVFSGAGTKNVVLADQVLAGDAKNGGKVTLSVYGPDNSDSITQSYAACEKPEPPATSVKVGLDAKIDRSTCKDGKGATVNVTATVAVNGAAKNVTVQLWSEVGGFSKTASLDFAKAGSQTVTWSLTATGTNGVHAKATLANGTTDSNLRTFGDDCQGT